MSSPCPTDLIREGHILRSRFIDHFVAIETWADDVAKMLSDNLKSTAPLSQKLNLIATEAKSAKSRFSHPHHVVPLLEQARQASTMRSHLVHSKLITARTSDARILWMFQNVAHKATNTNPFQVILDDQAFEREIKALNDLAKKLAKQSLKAPAPVVPAPASA